MNVRGTCYQRKPITFIPTKITCYTVVIMSNFVTLIILALGTVHVYRHSKFTTPTQVLSSLRVLLSLPPPTPSTPSQDLHKQAANGIAELVQARASLITQQSDWSILFTIIECIGLGISPEQSSNVVAMETTEEDPDGTLQSDSSVTETQKDLVIVTKIPTINSFDLFAEPVLPVHEPQVL